MTPKRDHLVVFAGQSNMVGHAKATDGAKPENPRVLAWSGGGTAPGAWQPARAGAAPFSEKPGAPNNIALHFADHLQRASGGTVYLVGRPVNGSTLLSWAGPDAGNMTALLSDAGAALAALPREVRGMTATAVLWSQGESDDPGATMIKTEKLDTLDRYAAGFAHMVGALRGQGWFGPDTAFLAAEMVENGWLAARNDFYRSPAHWPEGLAMAVASAEGLGHVGDRAHFSGSALEALGTRMFEAYRSLRPGSGDA